MNKKLFNILGLSFALFLTLLSAVACASNQTTTVTQTIVEPPYTPVPGIVYLTESQAVGDAVADLPTNIVTADTAISAVLDINADGTGEWFVIFDFSQVVTASVLGWPEVISQYGATGGINEIEIVIDAQTGHFLRRGVTFFVTGGPPYTNPPISTPTN
jgi:hypothetical protein